MKTFHVLNLGAGVQSTALYLLARDGKFSFDVCVFADTQEEPEAVYKHLEYLKSLGSPSIWVRTAGSLGENLIHGKNAKGGRFVSIPAFTKDDNGKVGITQRQCTKEYKIEVVDRAIRRELLGLKYRQHIPKDVLIRQYFGISVDEAARAERAKKRFEKVRHTVPVYPLIEMGWSRKDCLVYLKDKLPHVPPRSACTFCPYRTNQEWLRLKTEDPTGWKRAVEIDEALRNPSSVGNKDFRQELFVHRSCVPLSLVDFGTLTPNTLDPMSGECQGMCGM